MKKTLNIAHRGFTRAFPDNTLEAFEAAIQIGVDAIECDIHETADSQFVVFHDPEVLGENINKLRLAEVRNVKLEGGFEIPTLEQTLDLCSGRVRLMLELKQVRSLERFVKIVTARVKPRDVILISFNRDIVLKLSHLAPEIERSIDTAFAIKEPVAMAESARSDAIAVRCPFATVKLVEEVHAHNLSVFVWGCTGITDIRRVLALDIDGIISDFPHLVAEELGRTGLSL